MKKLFFKLFIGSCILLPGYVSAQSVLKINILSPIVKTANLSFEQAISTTSSIQLGFFYTGWSNDLTKFSGFGITPEYRFYLSDTESPEGVYAAPFLRYQKFRLTDKEIPDNKADYSSFGGGLVLGKQWVFKEKITLDIFLGPAYYTGKISGESGGSDFDTEAFDGFTLRTGINFGFKF